MQKNARKLANFARFCAFLSQKLLGNCLFLFLLGDAATPEVFAEDFELGGWDTG